MADLENDESLSLAEYALTSSVARVAIVSSAIKEGNCLLHRHPDGNTLYVSSRSAADEALKLWPEALFWGDFSDGTGLVKQ